MMCRLVKQVLLVGLVWLSGTNLFASPTRFLEAKSYFIQLGDQAVSGDFNGDGKRDVVTSSHCIDGNCFTGSVQYMLGNGDGTFGTPTKILQSDEFGAMTVADFNRDGRDDLVVAEGNFAGADLVIFFGKPGGVFQAPVRIKFGGTAKRIITGDFNHDGNIDLAIADSQGPSLTILLGNGNGTFRTPRRFAVPAIPTHLVTGDFNRDGFADIAMTIGSVITGINDVLVYRGDGTGNFAKSLTLGVGDLPLSIATSDFNGDGVLDLAVFSGEVIGNRLDGNGSITVFLGGAGGTFGSPETVKFTEAIPEENPNFSDPPELSIIPVKLRNGGPVDLVFGLMHQVGILQGNGNGTFQPATFYVGAGEPMSLTIGDFNRDGDVDVISVGTDSGNSSLTVLLGNGDTSFQGARLWPSNLGAPVTGVATGDFNRDGKPDVAVVGGDVAVMLGQGFGRFANGVRHTTGTFSFAIAAGDVNNDGKLDLVMVGTDGISVILGNGNGTFQAAKLFGPVISALGAPFPPICPPQLVDLNGDGKLDIVVANMESTGSSRATGFVRTYLGNGDGTFKAPNIFDVHGSLAATWLGTGDHNGDGIPDLIVLDSRTPEIQVMLGNGDGTFRWVMGDPLLNDAIQTLVTADFNRDGSVDVAAPLFTQTDPHQSGVKLFLGIPSGFSTPPDIPLPGDVSGIIQTADLNGDGRPDLVLGAGLLSLATGNGTFGNLQSSPALSDSSVFAELNADGALDLVTLRPDGVAVYLNTGGTFIGLALSKTSAVKGTPITMTSTVSASVRGSGTPTGTVRFMDGSKTLGTATLASGRATFTTSALAAGSHTIRTEYVGNSTFNPNQSAPHAEMITP